MIMWRNWRTIKYILDILKLILWPRQGGGHNIYVSIFKCGGPWTSRAQRVNAISKIINRAIILLETLPYNDTNYYKKLSYFNHNKRVNPIIEDIIFINYDKDIHYQLLKPNKKFIIERINNKEENYDKIIFYDRVKKIIIDTSKNLNYNLSCINIKVESENNNEKKSNEKMLYKTITDINDNDIKSEDEEKSESNNSENNSLVTTKKIKENDDKDKKGKNKILTK